MAPELLSFRPNYSTKSDIYAFGIVMWEIATRKLPYEDAAPAVIHCLVAEGEREQIPTGCPDGYTELMQKCWAQNPQERPSIDGVLQEVLALKQRNPNMTSFDLVDSPMQVARLSGESGFFLLISQQSLWASSSAAVNNCFS